MNLQEKHSLPRATRRRAHDPRRGGGTAPCLRSSFLASVNTQLMGFLILNGLPSFSILESSTLLRHTLSPSPVGRLMGAQSKPIDLSGNMLLNGALLWQVLREVEGWFGCRRDRRRSGAGGAH